MQSQRQRLLDQLLHRAAHRTGARTRRIELELEQIRLHVDMARIEYIVHLITRRHLRHIVRSIHHVRYVHNLLGQHFADLLAHHLPLVLVAEAQLVEAHRPHLPRRAFGLKRPAAAFALKELEADLTGAAAVVGAQLFAEGADLTADDTLERGRRTAHVRKVNVVAVDVHVADGADRVPGVAVVRELADAAVEQDGVEDAGHHLVHLAALDAELKHLRAGVHCMCERGVTL